MSFSERIEPTIAVRDEIEAKSIALKDHLAEAQKTSKLVTDVADWLDHAFPGALESRGRWFGAWYLVPLHQKLRQAWLSFERICRLEDIPAYRRAGKQASRQGRDFVRETHRIAPAEAAARRVRSGGLSGLFRRRSVDDLLQAEPLSADPLTRRLGDATEEQDAILEAAQRDLEHAKALLAEVLATDTLESDR